MNNGKPLQLFGSIERDGETVQAMFCMDIDRTDEVMLHLCDNAAPAVGLFRFLRKGNGAIELEPIAIFRTNENGGLWLPKLSESEFKYFQGFHGTLHENDESLEGDWTHSSGKRGRMIFDSPRHSAFVTPSICTNWDDFKRWASHARDNSDAAVFRGHGSNKFRLKTTLHRAGRHRLERYCAETLFQFRSHAEAVLGMRFNMSDGDDYSMLLGLAQHHGLPAPLLDWTSSPYIAAFFAFTDAIESSETRPDDTHVRIYGLTRDFVTNWSPPVVTLPYHSPYVASLSILPRNNPRLYAQQGHFLVTNVSDVERYIYSIEQKTKRKILIAADVPIACASEALEDLKFMGLTAATLFPGLDGVCKMIKHEMTFKRRPLPISGKPASA